jgi:hypothetical protein
MIFRRVHDRLGAGRRVLGRLFLHLGGVLW